MALTDPITKADFLVTVQGLSHYWQTFSGIKDQARTGEYSDGFNKRMKDRVGSRKVQPITLTKGYDPDQDEDLILYWRQEYQARRQAQGRTIIIQPVQYVPEPENIGTPFTLFDFRPTEFNIAESDKTSQDTAIITLIGVFSDWSKGQ
jgi:hypothetical protein